MINFMWIFLALFLVFVFMTPLIAYHNLVQIEITKPQTGCKL